MSFFRTYHIIQTFYRYRLQALFPPLPWYWRLCLWLLRLAFPLSWLPCPIHAAPPQRLTQALIQLGPLFVKFGQILSLRLELLPRDLVDALSMLQDNVPPFSPETARQILIKRFKQPPESVFKKFNPQPLAAASIAQVHEAILQDDTAVVVKILRPNVKKAFQQDMSVLRKTTHYLLRLYPELKTLQPLKIIDQITQLVHRECDFRYEAANCSLVKHHFESDPRLFTPKVYWDYCHEDILVIDKIVGIAIDDLETLNARQVNLKKLAHHGVAIFFTQVFEHGFFHGDMHPGNVFVDTTDPENPRYLTIDFGIMGSVTADDQRILAALFLAFFQRDYSGIAFALNKAGWTSTETDCLLLEGHLRQALEPFFDQPIAKISFGQVLIQLFQAASTLHLHIPPHLILLQKTLLNVESLGKRLYPDLDLWETAQPFLKQFKKRHYGTKALWRELKKAWPDWVTELPQLPHLLYQHLRTSSR
jgi:ubiquinone biosynthesis protein